jgi:hypothetical protein
MHFTHMHILFSLGIKQPEREAGYSPSLSTRDKNAWIFTSTQSAVRKYRDNFLYSTHYKNTRNSRGRQPFCCNGRLGEA